LGVVFTGLLFIASNSNAAPIFDCPDCITLSNIIVDFHTFLSSQPFVELWLVCLFTMGIGHGSR
jgi:hypothetical protein